MVEPDNTWAERRRRIAMRPDAHLHIRHDAWRFMPPGSPRYSGRDVVKYFWPDSSVRQIKQAAPTIEIGRNRAFEAEVAELRWLLADLRLDLALRQFAANGRKYSPDQPRVPAGSSEGGRWTSGTGTSPTRLAASDTPRLGAARIAIALEVAKKLIQAFRSENGLYDLFRSKTGAVTFAEVDGRHFFGTNSQSWLFGSIDRAETENLRDRLLADYPDQFNADNIGRMPNDALYHAETNVLLRIARETGGTLAGRSFDVIGDRILCNNCEAVLPYVGLELGNPTVTFFDPRGRVGTIRNGIFHREVMR